MLAQSPSLVFSFKMKFIQYACTILRNLYHDDERVSRMKIVQSSEDLKKWKQDTKWKAFELIEVVTQSRSDLNEVRFACSGGLFLKSLSSLTLSLFQYFLSLTRHNGQMSNSEEMFLFHY